MDFSSSAGQGYMCTTPAQQSSAADPSVNPAPLPRISPLSSSPRLEQPLPTTPQGPSARQAAVLLPLYFPLSWWSWGRRGGGNKRADVAFLPSLPPPPPLPTNTHSLSLLAHPLATCITALGSGKGECKFISQNHSPPATKVMPLYREGEGEGEGRRYALRVK